MSKIGIALFMLLTCFAALPALAACNEFTSGIPQGYGNSQCYISCTGQGALPEGQCCIEYIDYGNYGVSYCPTAVIAPCGSCPAGSGSGGNGGGGDCRGHKCIEGARVEFHPPKQTPATAEDESVVAARRSDDRIHFVEFQDAAGRHLFPLVHPVARDDALALQSGIMDVAKAEQAKGNDSFLRAMTEANYYPNGGSMCWTPTRSGGRIYYCGACGGPVGCASVKVSQ